MLLLPKAELTCESAQPTNRNLQHKFTMVGNFVFQCYNYELRGNWASHQTTVAGFPRVKPKKVSRHCKLVYLSIHACGSSVMIVSACTCDACLVCACFTGATAPTV
eukprot:scpid63626/ scgid24145/ 